MIELTKIYIRYREGEPETVLSYYARSGFYSYAIEIEKFEWVDDIDNMNDLSPTVGVFGYIGDWYRGLTKIGKPIPEQVDYPPELSDLLYRKIWKGTLGEVRNSNQKLFIKPIELKAFSGFVWDGSKSSRMRVVTQDSDIPVWISEVIDFRSEYRTFILDGEILECRKYKGDWSLAPDKSVVEDAVKEMQIRIELIV